MPGREKENLDNLLHMSQILPLVSAYNQIFCKLSKYEYRRQGKQCYISMILKFVQNISCNAWINIQYNKV